MKNKGIDKMSCLEYIWLTPWIPWFQLNTKIENYDKVGGCETEDGPGGQNFNVRNG